MTSTTSAQRQASSAPRVAWRRYCWPLPWALAGLLLFVAWPGLPRLVSALSYPYQMDAEEGFILGQALRLKAGATIYPTLADPPWLVGNYTPLFPLLYSVALPTRPAAPAASAAAHALGQRLSGQLPEPQLHGLLAALNPSHATLPARLDDLPRGRRLVLGSLGIVLLAMGLLAGWLVWPPPGPPAADRLRPWAVGCAALAPALLLASYETLHWAAFVRVDFPALMWTLLGLLAVAHARRPLDWATAGLLFCAALYTRQTALLAPLACALALASRRQWRALGWLLLPPLLAGLLALATLQWTTGGEFLRHTFRYNANMLDWHAWRLVMRNELWFFSRWLLLAALPALALVLSRRCRPADEDEPPPLTCGRPLLLRILGLYALLGVLPVLGMAKVGSAPNYLLEPLAGLALWLVALAGQALTRPSLPRSGWPAAHRLLAALVWVALLLHVRHVAALRPIITSSAAPTTTDRVLAGRLLADVRAAGAPVLSEAPIFTLLAGQPPLHQPFIMAQLAREGAWNSAPLEALLRAGAFSLLVLQADLRTGGPEYDRWTAAQATAIRAGYSFAGELVLPGVRQPYYLWRPRSLPGAASR